ncbi:MarR family winged helix-turn-helix transcriptional regulator [Occultella gossypii]|uniref:Winged helix-turn-helix transcriptional regulator n=1 Tax=Occultella gossypii TaxID=2800820 RepID=A0ABS7SDD9_9MICO|nr:MarR family winged helix-turn-helix transcriptional regulator [Occultella gossypii]MBZ2198185.1 winged helix-turn-helix transcriptional regulator [Occultella gossypii]
MDALAQVRSDVRGMVPASSLTGILGLTDVLGRIGQAGMALTHRIESVTGVRAGELQVLVAVEDGAEHPRAIAAVTGQLPEAAEVTVKALVARGLLNRHAHPADTSGEPALVHVTPIGTAALEQAEAVQIRIVDALARTLGGEQTQDLNRTLKVVADVLEHGNAITDFDAAAGPTHLRTIEA